MFKPIIETRMSQTVTMQKQKNLYRSSIMLMIVFILMLTCSIASANNSFKAVAINPDTPPATKIAVQASVGLYNGQKGGSVYTYMKGKDPLWLDELNLHPDEIIDASSFLEQALIDFPKCVRYSYSNQRKLIPNILTIAAVLEAVPIDENMAVKCDNVAFDAITQFSHLNTPYLATKYVYDNYVNDTVGLAMLNPGYKIHDSKGV
jgi:hypothetical protein